MNRTCQNDSHSHMLSRVPMFRLSEKNACIVLKNSSKIFEDKGNSIEINRYMLGT